MIGRIFALEMEYTPIAVLHVTMLSPYDERFASLGLFVHASTIMTALRKENLELSFGEGQDECHHH